MASVGEPFVEKRKYPRVRALLLVGYCAHDGGIQKTAAAIGRTLDISSSGTRLEVYERIDPGSALEVEIAVGETILSTPGKYVHSTMVVNGVYVVGIEFNRLNPDLVALFGDPVQYPDETL